MTRDKGGKSRGGGPKTARGKSVSRWNALKHGATAKQLFILQGPHLPEFDRYKKLAEDLQEELAAGAYLEDQVLVQKFVANALIAERCDRLLLRLLPQADETVACEVAPISFRYIEQGQRNSLRSLAWIRELRDRVEETEALEAAVEAESVGEQTGAEQYRNENVNGTQNGNQHGRSGASAPEAAEQK